MATRTDGQQRFDNGTKFVGYDLVNHTEKLEMAGVDFEVLKGNFNVAIDSAGRWIYARMA